MLNDWTDESPERIFTTLKKQGGHYNFARPTAADFFRDVRDEGPGRALARNMRLPLHPGLKSTSRPKGRPTGIRRSKINPP